MEHDKTHWIFASLYKGEYVAEELNELPDDSFANLEYEDVKRKEYQIWEYPSGKIFDIQPDRQLSSSQNQSSTPYGKAGTVWLPQLIEVGVDKEKVTAAYNRLS